MTPARIARLWAADYLSAAHSLVDAALPGRDAEQYRSADAPRGTIVVLPGVYETWQFLRPTIEHLYGIGFSVHVMTELGRNAGTVPDAAQQVAAYLEHRELTDVTIVAHSKGGLIGKYAMALLDREARIDRMTAIATPFLGSRYATWLPVRSLRAFAPADPVTRLLAEQTNTNARITSIWAEFDPHIPEGSFLPGAHNVRLEGVVGHFRILATAALRDALDASLPLPGGDHARHPS